MLTCLVDRGVTTQQLKGFGVLGVIAGLLVGFVGGLFASEYQRMGDAGKAWRTSWQAIKATGAGVLVEFFCAAAAIITWVVGLFLHF